MEELKTDKQFNVLKWIFIVVSIIHVIYATVTMRGMYLDGSFNMIDMLDNLTKWQFEISADSVGHPRFLTSLLTQLPVMFGFTVLFIKSKFALMMIYSFTLFALPLLFLWWNYKLSQRTNRIDIFFWSLFCYCSILITFSIFAVVESIFGAILHFILWNYLVLKEEYKKRDIFFIIFLIAMMFFTYEYVAILGIIFFIAALYYSAIEPNKNSKITKRLIGIGSLGAAVYNIIFMLNIPNEADEIQRFFQEWVLCYNQSINLNLSISVITVALLLYFIFNNKRLSKYTIWILATIYAFWFGHLISNPTSSINPMLEGHFRVIPCLFLPLVFIFLFIIDLIKKEINQTKFSNFICIVLLCGITQTCWQMVNTYYWNQNIQYMKNELASVETPLYIPSEHKEISSFHNNQMRRYIWHSIYTCTSILFSDSYKQKTILMHYDNEVEEANYPCREYLYVIQDLENQMKVPYNTMIDIKNRFWDLTECAKALDEYNKQNNIQTWQ